MAKAAESIKSAAKGTALDPLDLYGVRAALTEEERLVQDSVARLVDEEVLPVIQRCFEEHRFPRELIPRLAAQGLLGSSIDGYDCAGLNAICYGLICQELERGVSDLRLRLGGAEAALPAADGARRGDRLLRAHRAARRLGPGEHEDARQAAR